MRRIDLVNLSPKRDSTSRQCQGPWMRWNQRRAYRMDGWERSFEEARQSHIPHLCNYPWKAWKNHGRRHNFLSRVELESPNDMGLKRTEMRDQASAWWWSSPATKRCGSRKANIETSARASPLTSEETKASVIWALATISQARGRPELLTQDTE